MDNTVVLAANSILPNNVVKCVSYLLICYFPLYINIGIFIGVSLWPAINFQI